MRPTVRHVQETVAEHFEIPVSAMRWTPRNVYAAENTPRHIAMFFARRVTGKSHKVIARLFGRDNHTTTIHAVRRVEQMIAANDAFAAEMETLAEVIGS